MAVVKKSFVKGFTAKVLDKDKNRLPALYVGSRIPWSGIHERGGSISGRMLIPLHGRVGRKRFKTQIAELMRGGNAYFIKNAKGNIVLMAENIKEYDRPLSGFKRRYRIWFASMPLPLMALACVLAVFIICQFITADLQSFIYFQF